jgi:uncharacterized damage-inducible protein DinB
VDVEELEALDPEHVPDADELTVLTRYLDFYRAVMVRKAQGLSQAQLATRLGPSTLTLGGLIKHLALVEDFWFHERLLGHPPNEPWASVDWDADPDWDFHSAVDDDPAELIRMYEQACDHSRAAVASVGDLDATTKLANRRGQTFSLRWVLIHMIEETCRHAGHADLLRESIDGVTGD